MIHAMICTSYTKNYSKKITFAEYSKQVYVIHELKNCAKLNFQCLFFKFLNNIFLFQFKLELKFYFANLKINQDETKIEFLRFFLFKP